MLKRTFPTKNMRLLISYFCYFSFSLYFTSCHFFFDSYAISVYFLFFWTFFFLFVEGNLFHLIFGSEFCFSLCSVIIFFVFAFLFFFLLYLICFLSCRHCDTHFIALYEGTVPSDKKLATVCESKKTELIFKGPNLLLEFNAGAQVPPFDYNGFSANLEFIEGPLTSILPPTLSPNISQIHNTNSHHRHNFGINRNVDNNIGGGIGTNGIVPLSSSVDSEWPPTTTKFSPCDKIIIESNGRSGHFDTRGRPFASNCRIIFKGKSTDVVHLSLFNYRLKAQACRSVIEIVDGSLDTSISGTVNKKSLHKMCSPTVRYARNPEGNFLPPQTFISTGSQIMIVLRRFHGSSGGTNISQNDEEFIDGAYMFHDGTAYNDKFQICFSFFLAQFK